MINRHRSPLFWTRVFVRPPMSALLGLLQLFRQVRVLVILVQRIATGGQSLAWRRGAIAEGSANTLALNLAGLGCLPKKLGISEHHPAEPHEVNPAFAHG